MTDRSTILREMGLTPIWASRSATTAQPTEQTTVVSERADGPSTPERDAQIAAMSWQALAASITQCTACALSHSRNKAVPGMGDPAASWMVIGDAPDDHDDKQGVAFTDQAGQLLDAMLKSVGKTGCLAYPSRQMPPAQQSSARTRRNQGLRALPQTPDRACRT
jgi:uracil-DNA glycosylase